MTRGLRPFCRNTVGQRKAEEANIDGPDRLLHYCDIFITRFEWSGAPAVVPHDYIERNIFFTGGIGAVQYGEEIVPIGGEPVLCGALGEVMHWMPIVLGINPNVSNFEKILTQRNILNDPYMVIDDMPMQMQIGKHCELQSSAWISLRQNLKALRQPILLQSVTGGEINSIQTEKAIENGCDIQVLNGAGVQAAVLDMNGQDHTQNLITTINALDAEVLSIMGIPGIGTAKTSGITPEESSAISTEMKLILEHGLEIRRRAAEYLNEKAGLNLSVKINPRLAAFLEDMQDGEQDRTDNLTENERTNEARRNEE